MKKIITLLLLLVGGITQMSAVTIYVQNTRAWSTIYLYEWNESGSNASFPGVQQCVSEIINGDWYFKINVTRDHFILSQNGDSNIRTNDLSTSDYTEENAYYWIWEDHKGLTKMDAPTAIYNYNLTVKADESITISNIYAFNDNTPLAASWPGAYVIASDGEYNLKIGSNDVSGGIGVIFNQGDGGAQTCNLTAKIGDNAYYIGSIASSANNGSWGEYVKTNSSGYATYVSTDALTIPSGVAYYATDNDNGSATATALTNPAASTPMLIKGDASTTYVFATAASGETPASNAFKAGEGSAVDSEDGGYNYILNGDTFYAANGKTVATGRAYLQLSKKAAARALIFEDEDVTGISTIDNSQMGIDNYYNLGGQRVAQPTKGLYIVNGKKVVIR